MVKVTCQYTGITFEAASKRQKNHPRVSALLNDAARAGTYGTAVERLAEARELGMTDINAIIAFARAGAAEAAQQRSEREYERKVARKQAQREWSEQREERARTKAILRSHGYTWSKGGDEEDMDFAGPNAGGEGRWILSAPDGRIVTVREALAEIG